MKINSGGNLRGIITTTCDYTSAKAETSLTHHPNRSENSKFGCHVFRKNYTQDWPVRSSFNPKIVAPKLPLFLWCGLTQRLKTWCEKLGVWMLWDGMSWNLITWFTPWKVNMEHKNHPIERKIIWTKPFIIVFQPLIFRGVWMGFSGIIKFHTLTIIFTRGLEILSGFAMNVPLFQNSPKQLDRILIHKLQLVGCHG